MSPDQISWSDRIRNTIHSNVYESKSTKYGATMRESGRNR